MKLPLLKSPFRFTVSSRRQRLAWAVIAILVLLASLMTFRFRHYLPTAVSSHSTELVFLLPSDSGFEVARTRANLSQVEQLTASGGKVNGFAVSPDGEMILFSQQNDAGGSDVWRVNRAGGKADRVAQCGISMCDEIVWSPDSFRAAYTRVQRDGAGEVLVWVRETNTTFKMRIGNLIEARYLAWSPDAAQLAFFDQFAGSLRVVDATTGEDVFTSAARLTGAPDWSPDGKSIAYSAEEDSNGFTRSSLFIYNVEMQTAEPIQTGAGDMDISPPRWSPDGNWLVIGQRTLPGSPAKQLFLIRSDGLDFEAIVDDVTATHTAYHWSPDGQQIVYQQFELGSSQNRPEVWVWERGSGESRKIVQNAIQPQWLP